MRRAPTLGVEVRGALNLVGALVRYFSLAFILPAGIAVGYDEPVWPFLAAATITAAGGWSLERLTRGTVSIGAREGFLIVALTWLAGALVISLPYLFIEPQLRNPIDAYF